MSFKICDFPQCVNYIVLINTIIQYIPAVCSTCRELNTQEDHYETKKNRENNDS